MKIGNSAMVPSAIPCTEEQASSSPHLRSSFHDFSAEQLILQMAVAAAVAVVFCVTRGRQARHFHVEAAATFHALTDFPSHWLHFRHCAPAPDFGGFH